MPRWIVKVGHYKDQVRITIPKALAVESGLFEAKLAEIRPTEANKVEVIVFHEKPWRPGSGENYFS